MGAVLQTQYSDDEDPWNMTYRKALSKHQGGNEYPDIGYVSFAHGNLPSPYCPLRTPLSHHGEIRDTEAARIAVQASLTSHLCCTLNTPLTQCVCQAPLTWASNLLLCFHGRELSLTSWFVAYINPPIPSNSYYPPQQARRCLISSSSRQQLL